MTIPFGTLIELKRPIYAGACGISERALDTDPNKSGPYR
jgi:hypothetical protein